MTEVKKEVTSGNILSTIATVIGFIGTLIVVGISYGTLQATAEVNTRALHDQENRLRAVEGKVASELAKINTKLESIEKAVQK